MKLLLRLYPGNGILSGLYERDTWVSDKNYISGCERCRCKWTEFKFVFKPLIFVNYILNDLLRPKPLAEWLPSETSKNKKINNMVSLINQIQIRTGRSNLMIE